MKKGKLILGGIAVLVTAGSALAFKAAKKFSNVPIYISVGGNQCLTCSDLFNTVGQFPAFQTSRCQTLAHVQQTGAIYTVKVSATKCANPGVGTQEQ